MSEPSSSAWKSAVNEKISLSYLKYSDNMLTIQYWKEKISHGCVAMLITFSVENWMSFKEKTTFSMVKSLERQHGERVPRIKKHKIGILPIAAMYGGNASGKSNFVKALAFAKDFVQTVTPPENLIKADVFCLDDQTASKPARFWFEILIDETIYEYSFAVTKKIVLEEKLVQITNTREKVLYDRKDPEGTLGKNQRLQFVHQGTRDNLLFLTNSVSQKVENFKSVYDWFRYKLELITPDAVFGPFDQLIDEAHPFHDRMTERLSQLDTGIVRLATMDVSFQDLSLPEGLKTQILEQVNKGMSVTLFADSGERFIFSRIKDEPVVKKQVAYHMKSDSSEKLFEMRQESDGTRRLIDLIQPFINLSEDTSGKVYVIDEIDRSLHTLLTRNLLETYLNCCTAKSRSQLIFTTHDVLLMDQDLLRRDEMWIAERDENGASSLVSFNDFRDVRYDKDVRRSYLQGRLGGIPQFLLGGISDNSCGGNGAGEDEE